MQFVAYVVRAPLCQRMPIVIGGSSGRPVVSGCAWEPRVTQPETFVEGRREILRQASVALGGRPVTVWEVSTRAELEPQASSEPAPTHHPTKLDVDARLRRWYIAVVQGSRWVGCQGAADGFWVVAPVRTGPPAPPPEGRERRSRERLTLELAGLCLGLLDRRELPAAPAPKRTDPLQDLATLPGIIAHEVANPLTAARAGLQLAMEALGRWTEVAAVRRLEMLDELGQVVEDIDRGANFLRAIKDRARGALARSEHLDRIFEPGFTTKEFGEGSGMGLVVVQSVVRNMFAGSINVESRPGGGTTVTVSLPVPPQRSLDTRTAGEPSAA